MEQIADRFGVTRQRVDAPTQGPGMTQPALANLRFPCKERRAACGGFVPSIVELGDGLRVGEVTAEGVSVAFQELVLASLEEDSSVARSITMRPASRRTTPAPGTLYAFRSPSSSLRSSPDLMATSG